MSFGEILNRGFRLLVDHFVLLTSIAAVVYLPLAIADYLVRADSMADLGLAVVFWLVTMCVSPIVAGAVTFAAGELYRGGTTTMGEALRVGATLFGGLVWTSLLVSIAVVIGLILLVAPGVYLACAFMIVTPVMVLERTFGFAALGRSRALMRGSLLRGFGTLFVVMLLTALLGVAVEHAFDALPVLKPVATAIAQAVGMVYLSAVGVVFYFDVRARKESFDPAHPERVVTPAGVGAGSVVPAPVA